jgi:hypothetical protein
MIFINLPIITTTTTLLLLATLAFTSPTPRNPDSILNPSVLTVTVKYQEPDGFQRYWKPSLNLPLRFDEPVPVFAASILEVPDGYDIKHVECQAYADDDARIPAGKRLKGTEEVLFAGIGEDTVWIRSLRCHYVYDQCTDKWFKCFLDRFFGRDSK